MNVCHSSLLLALAPTLTLVHFLVDPAAALERAGSIPGSQVDGESHRVGGARIGRFQANRYIATPDGLVVGGTKVLPESDAPTALPVLSLVPDDFAVGRHFSLHASPSGRSKAFIGTLTTLDAGGSGVNGPLTADYGQTISVIKRDFPGLVTPSPIGEIDGLSIYARQSGPMPSSEQTSNDMDGIQLNIAQYKNPGYAAAAEFLTTRTDGDDFRETHSIGLQMGVNDPWGKDAEQGKARYKAENRLTFGYVALANRGALDRAYYVTCSREGTWQDYFMGGSGASPDIRIKGCGAGTEAGALVFGPDGRSLTLTRDADNGLSVRNDRNTEVAGIARDGTLRTAGDAHVRGIFVNAYETLTGRGTIRHIPQSAPPSPAEGETYYDAALHKVRTWDGSRWQNHW